ncbi:leucine-rich repeat flightless-interacting protein 1 isoform X3 [Rousettus aegyptiacus]|uniref:leucine-rich repeat flightless-interacting protein 1 isoform X3 n=1 Tax=Rousettus aegyptiacus TaxID=9407 RepID=UPI00168D9465|nr:leucine-rich repeat flightless-interacting protein 1 isoform X3 [Rousettus aegyptiacus]
MTNPAATQNKEIDCLSPEAQRLAEARLAAKRAARAEARDIRMKELERQQKEEDSERYARGPRRNTSASDDDERASVGSRGSLRLQPDRETGAAYAWTNGYDGELYGSQSLSRRSGRNSSYGGDGRPSTMPSFREETSVEERPEKDFTEKGSRGLPGLSAATLASLGGASSRRGSAETSTSIDTEASIREIKELNDLKGQIQDVEGKYMQGLKAMKDSLAEVEEKYKRAMVSNAQLDNEKTNFMYQVDTLKEVLLELEEQLAESRRQYEERSKELEREKHAHSLLRFQLAEATAALKQREEMLEEIRQLQQKQASYVREISDLQETIEWKDKKIGALERQKEFFDSVRSERDDLREEVVMLKEELKKHGIILSSEVTTNGEASDTLNNVGCPGATKVTKEELNAIEATTGGTLGRANEVEVKNEIVENVGKREILPNTEQEQHKEDPIKDRVDPEVLPPDENAEDQSTPEDSAPSPGTLAEATDEEQAQSQTLESTSPLECTEQVGSDEVAGTPDGRSGAPLAQSGCLGELDSGSPGPRLGEVSCDALDSKNQSETPDDRQEQETQELKAGVGEGSTPPRPESAPSPTSEAERVTSTDSGDPGGSPTPGAAGAGLAGSGEQVGTVASSPPGYSEDTASREEECVVDVRTEQDSSPGGGLEKGPASQGPGEAGRGPLGMKEPSEESNDPLGEALDSSQKKTKNKKKKNKKKKSPAPVETPQEVREELTFPEPALSEGKEGGQVTPAGEKSGGETQNEATEKPGHEMVAGSREHVDCPENPEIELDGQLNGEAGEGRAEAGGAAGAGEPPPSPGAAGGESDEGVVKGGDADDAAAPGTPPGDAGAAPGNPAGDAGDAGAAPGSPAGDAGDAGAAPGSPAGDADATPGSPAGDAGDAGAAPGSPAGAECPTQTAGEGLDSTGLGDRAAAPAGELGDRDAEGKDEARGRNEDKSKEDCTLS